MMRIISLYILLPVICVCLTHEARSQTTLFSETFESYSNFQLTTATSGWRASTSNTYWGGTNSTNNLWYINDNTSSGCPITGSRSLMIGTSGGTKCTYTKTNNTDIVAYPVNGINVSGYSSLTLTFNAKANGECCVYDELDILYAYTNSSTTPPTSAQWSTPGYIQGVSSATAYSSSLGCPSNTYLWIGFEWYNDGSAGSDPPAVVDDIKVTGIAVSNDACASATTISLTQTNNNSANTSTFSGSAVGTNACCSADQSSIGCTTNWHNVWYKFVPTVSGSYYVSVRTGTMTYPDVQVFSGTCGAFSVVGCAGYSNATCQPYGYYSSTYSYAGGCSLTAGTTYYIMVDSYGGSAGTFTVNVVNLSNDVIPSAAMIVNCGTSFTSSTIGATNCGNCNGGGGCFDYTNLDCNSSTNAPSGSGGTDTYSGMTVENDSWYQFCTTSAGTYTVSFSPTSSTCIGPSNQLQMNLYSGSPSALTWVNGNATSGTLTYAISLAANGCGYIEVDGFAGSNCDYAITLSGACTLPIELLSFQGEKLEDNNIKLNWITSSERNADHYVIEKSADAKNYFEIGKLKAKGHSLDKNSYNLIDQKPLDGINYYRLITVNSDNIHEVAATTMVTHKTQLPGFTVYPNPSVGTINVSFNNFSSPQANIEIFNVYGELVWSNQADLSDGELVKEFDLTRLPQGTYLITASDGTQSFHRTLVISAR